MKRGDSIILIEILLLTSLLLSLFTGFPIPPEVLSKAVVAWLIGACLLLIITHRILGR